MRQKRTQFFAIFSIIVSLQWISMPQSIAGETLEASYVINGAETSVLSLDRSSVWVISYNNSTLLKYSTTTYQLLATVNIGGSAFDMALSPDGSKIYVALNAVSKIAVVSTSTATKTKDITTTGANYGVAFSPDGTEAYITTGSSVSKINTSNDSISQTTSISGASNLNDIKTSPDGRYIFLASNATQKVIKILADDFSVVATSPTIPTKYLAISPDGTIGYSFPYTGSNVIKFATSNLSILSTISGFSRPSQSGFTPDGNYIYVANSGAQNIIRLKVSDDTKETVITGLAGTPWHSTVDPSGNYLFIGSSGIPGAFYQYRLDGYSSLNLSLSMPRTAQYRTTITLTLEISTSTGRVTFYANNKRIATCKNLAITNGGVICNYKASIRGAVTIKAIHKNNSVETISHGNILVGNRSTLR